MRWAVLSCGVSGFPAICCRGGGELGFGGGEDGNGGLCVPSGAAADAGAKLGAGTAGGGIARAGDEVDVMEFRKGVRAAVVCARRPGGTAGRPSVLCSSPGLGAELVLGASSCCSNCCAGLNGVLWLGAALGAAMKFIMTALHAGLARSAGI